MSPAGAKPSGTGQSFPRVSGDEPNRFDHFIDLEQFSPRERG